MRDYKKYTVVGSGKEADPAVLRQIEEADRELEAVAAMSVTVRWSRRHVQFVKRAAKLMGVPYQTYIKMVVMERAMEDLQQGAATGANQ